MLSDWGLVLTAAGRAYTTHTQTHVHTHTHTETQACTHKHVCSCAHRHTYVHTQVHMHMQANAHTRVHIQGLAGTHVHIHAHPLTQPDRSARCSPWRPCWALMTDGGHAGLEPGERPAQGLCVNRGRRAACSPAAGWDLGGL